MTTGANPLSLDEAEQLISWADKDGDGVLNYKEFTHFLCGNKSQKQLREEEAQRQLKEAKDQAARLEEMKKKRGRRGTDGPIYFSPHAENAAHGGGSSRGRGRLVGASRFSTSASSRR